MDALNQITEGMTGQEVAQIIYQNDSNSLTDYIVSYLHPTEGVNGTNVYTLTTAIAKIPQDIRKQGITCTFLSINGWLSYKYIGNTIINDNWNTISNWILIATEKELSNLATQNSMMHLIESNKTVNVSFDEANTSVTISLPSGLFLSYGNTRIADSATINGQIIIDPMTSGKLKYLVYNLSENQYKLVDYADQMNNSVLVGWVNQYLKEAILRCNNYFVNGVSRSFRNYIPKSNIAHDLTTTDTNKVLGADQAAILATQNGWLFPHNKGGIRFKNIDTTGMSLTIDGRYSVSWGNTVVSNNDNTSQKVISASDVYSTMYLIYHADNDTFTWEKAASQMRGGVLLGWYNYVTDKVYLNCDEYTINGMPASNYDLAEIAYNNIPTTVIQLKKYADGGHLNINMTSSIDTEVKITGGRVSFDPTDFRESSVNIRKGIATNLYFRCVEPYAVIEAKGVYALSSDSQFSNSYVSQNIRDFGKGVTQLIFQYNNNISGNIYDIPRDVNYLMIGGGDVAKNTIKGDFSDFPRLMTFLQITSAESLINGDVADLPRKLEYIYLNTSSGSNITGNVSDLPRSLEVIQMYNLTSAFTGNIIDAPRMLTTLLLSGPSFIISGNVTDLPPLLNVINISGKSTISGDILDLPKQLTSAVLAGECSLKGRLADLPIGIIAFNIKSTDVNNQITGDISNIPNKTMVFLELYGHFNVTFNGDFPLSDKFYNFKLAPEITSPIDSATVDNILIKLAAIAGERTGTRTIALTGACAAPTEASQAAITSLQQKGFTVQTN